MAIPPQSSLANSHHDVTDPESGLELARLVNKDRLVTQNMGGLLPEQVSLEGIQRVLDIGCGPGGWAIDLAFMYRHMQILGIDISHSCIRYAHEQARIQQLPNVTFEVMDVTKHPLHLPNSYFDLINARFLCEFMPTALWPAFILECKRLLRPGGTLRLTEFEMGQANAPAHQELSALFIKAMRKLGRAFNPDGRHLGVIAELLPSLQEAGFLCNDKTLRAYAVNYSFGATLQEEWCKDLIIFAYQALPFIAKANIASMEEVELLYKRMEEEMKRRAFRAIFLYLTAWGTKPA